MPLLTFDPPPFVSGWCTTLNDGFVKFRMARRPEKMFVSLGDYKEYEEWLRRTRPELLDMAPCFKGVHLAVDDSLGPGECSVLWGEGRGE